LSKQLLTFQHVWDSYLKASHVPSLFELPTAPYVPSEKCQR